MSDWSSSIYSHGRSEARRFERKPDRNWEPVPIRKSASDSTDVNGNIHYSYRFTSIIVPILESLIVEMIDYLNAEPDTSATFLVGRKHIHFDSLFVAPSITYTDGDKIKPLRFGLGQREFYVGDHVEKRWELVLPAALINNPNIYAKFIKFVRCRPVSYNNMTGDLIFAGCGGHVRDRYLEQQLTKYQQNDPC